MNALREWLDKQLNMISMYHVVVIGLGLMVAVAFGLMVVGYLSYSPAAFLMHVGLMTGGAYVANRVFGWLFGVRPHAESAVITGLILALLFTPPVSVLAAVKLMLVAAIAMASKYILTVRGKHIFNPVAIAVAIASIGQLAYASWWIATPAMLPVTLVAVGMIVYKTQKITMVLIFLAVSMGLIVTQGAITGPMSWQTLTTAITSWPLLFFAGVMLTEPQTLPPRRKQQHILAIMVAVLMMIPLHYATIVMTPALALVIGNLWAFYVGPRRGIVLRLIDKKPIGADGYELLFDTKPFSFVPGQYIELSLPHKGMDKRGMRRVFTIIGKSHDEQISIATRLPEPASSFKRALTGVKKGQVIYGTRVAGDFILPTDSSAPIVFIAGGIGITPFISFLQDQRKRDMTLIYAVHSMADLMFVDTLKQYDVKVVIVTTDTSPLPDASWIHKQDTLTQSVIKQCIPMDTKSHIYISGPPTMVTQTRRIIKELGADHIYTDHFTGY